MASRAGGAKMLTNIRLLFELIWQPAKAIRSLRDRAPVAFAVCSAWSMVVIYSLCALPMVRYAQAGGRRRYAVPGSGEPALSGALELVAGNFFSVAFGSAMIVLFVAVVYVPAVILMANALERRGSYSLVMAEEYASTLSCALASLTVSLMATLLPAALISWQSAWLTSDAVPGYFVLLVVIPLPVFAALMSLSVGIIFGSRWIVAMVATIVSMATLIGLPLLMQAATFICASPIMLLMLLFLLRDRIDAFMGSARARQSFKQNLEAATLNPADASAHYNLGLLYQKRGELGAAAESFRKAVAIDDGETDAHYQLGRIARARENLTEAIGHFEKVVRQDPAHSHHEIWRETAIVYYLARQYEDALEMLGNFLRERPSDAEGHYWRGMVLEKLGRPAEAASEMQACVESVKSAPAYKYRIERQWLHKAQAWLRER